nr:biotin-dependent carboxyltransferase family protein [Hasllibacter sp. MH4015]
MSALIVHKAGPGVTVQDLGRPGFLAFGLSRGGAADRLAMAEGPALLGQAPDLAAIEMAGMGATFEATGDIRIALTGAKMRATLDGEALAWNASHLVAAGAQLAIGVATSGVYGYLHVGGGVATERELASRAAHANAGLGVQVVAGAEIPLGDDRAGEVGLVLSPEDRFHGGTIRVVPSLQTDVFARDLDRFQAMTFRRDARGNRMGVRCVPVGEGFFSEAGLSILSEVITPGDIQVTGDGTPFVLLADCQTTGGYPRIGSVLPCDLPRVAQAAPGAELRFKLITLDEAVAAERKAAEARAGLRRGCQPLVRDVAAIHDLLGYQLISGVTAGWDEED